MRKTLPTVRAHWTPRYLADRIALAVHQRRHPDAPWLTPQAVWLLEQWIRPGDTCLEWGSGRSTAWFTEHRAVVHSIEHDAAWYATVSRDLAGRAGSTIELQPSEDAYVHAGRGDVDIDIALVDGVHRDRCALVALDRVRPGGLLIVDNAERYLPNRSRGPESIGDRHLTERWEEFGRRTASWRRIWTSNGVTDTALFVRPSAEG